MTVLADMVVGPTCQGRPGWFFPSSFLFLSWAMPAFPHTGLVTTPPLRQTHLFSPAAPPSPSQHHLCYSPPQELNAAHHGAEGSGRGHQQPSGQGHAEARRRWPSPRRFGSGRARRVFAAGDMSADRLAEPGSPKVSCLEHNGARARPRRGSSLSSRRAGAPPGHVVFADGSPPLLTPISLSSPDLAAPPLLLRRHVGVLPARASSPVCSPTEKRM
jgi:hypothetical protein